MGYALTIDGCPWIFTTQQHAAVTSTDADWPAAGATVARGFLELPDFAWTERVAPIDGDLDVSAPTFTLHDATATSGTANDSPLLTWLATRRHRRVTSTVLTADLTAAATTLTVADATLFTYPCTLWVEREAIRCASRTGTTTINVDAGGRGYLGTRAVAHRIDATNEVRPEVWGDYPWVTRRRVILWRVDDADVATPLWRGYASRAPRLADDGARFELQCEHAWTYHRNLPVALPDAQTRLRGFNDGAINLQLSYDGQPRPFLSSQVARVDPTTRMHDTFDGAMDAALRHLRDVLADAGVSATVSWLPHGRGVALQAQMTLAAPLTVRLGVGSRTVVVTSTDGGAYTEGGLPRAALRTARAVLEPIPPVLVHVANGVDAPLPVTDTSDLPASWATASYTDEGYTTRVTATLAGDYDDDRRLVVAPASVAAAPPVVTGVTRLEAREPTGTRGPEPGSLALDRATVLTAAVRVESEHWACALKRVISDDGDIVRAGADPRDWDWSALPTVLAATADAVAARTYYFDGTQQLGDVLGDALKLHGCALGVRASRLALFAFRVPLPTDPPAATLTRAQFVAPPHYTSLPDGLANVATLEGDKHKVVVRDSRSVGRYGPARDVTLRLRGAGEAVARIDQPRALATYVLHRVLGAFSEPCEVGTFTVALDAGAGVYLGDVVRIDNDWLLPDGTGGRGWTGVLGQVIGRTVDLRAGTVALEVLRYGLDGVAGYAPCARVASLSGATITLAAPGYVNGVSDYAGSDRAGYDGTAHDGGTSKFNAGDAVELIRRDHTTLVVESLVVDSVDPATRTIKVTPTPTTAIGAGETWDLRAGRYGAAQAAQRDYAYVSSRSAGGLGATPDPHQVWAP